MIYKSEEAGLVLSPETDFDIFVLGELSTMLSKSTTIDWYYKTKDKETVKKMGFLIIDPNELLALAVDGGRKKR